MDIAYEEAMKLKDEYISTEHILLAIASERNTPSANILREANVTKERIAEAIDSRSATASASPNPTPRANIACWRNMAAT